MKIAMQRDPIKSKDIIRWLEYTGWTEEEFDTVADSFRDPRVWWIRGNEWCKLDLDGTERTYGKVFLDESQKKKYYQD
jgi:hypothetical protein